MNLDLESITYAVVHCAEDNSVCTVCSHWFSEDKKTVRFPRTEVHGKVQRKAPPKENWPVYTVKRIFVEDINDCEVVSRFLI